MNCDILGIKEQYQYPILPTGCEVTSVSMLLTHLGIDICTKEYLADFITKESDPSQLIGGNPFRSFVGSPYSKDSFGVYHGGISNLLQLLVSQESQLNSKYQVTDLTALTNNDSKYSIYLPQTRENIQNRLDYFESNNIEENDDYRVLESHLTTEQIPIVIWMTIDLNRTPYISDEWLDEKDYTKTIYWISPQHCALLSGYTDKEYIIYDPHTGKKELYPKHLFLKRWRQYGRQSVSLKKIK
ncbi:hypothetical protein DLAC_03331 [Tieghemostelium lacteum]|uniref:Peptidase C39-like domain-containing protein n=1 Tax=Tieghemostelium lacteum TaxID=361077 RepID=A0A152A249_TIELA|nr:hypothetical protein DLAC_03331 [Tieghemostelium lacteum]|eukprot:KYR00175.1 hypothetical protein DLAC_03331 [Tieghemostelium lacteum]